MQIPASVLLALWAPSPSSRGLELLEGLDAVHTVRPIASVPAGSRSILSNDELAMWWDGSADSGANTGMGDTQWTAASDGREDTEAAPELSLSEWLDQIRPLDRVAAILPDAADPLPGLAAALDAGEAVLLQRMGEPRPALLVPESAGASLRWTATALPAPVPPFDATFARREVYQVTEDAIEALGVLDLARERPELADQLTDILTWVIPPALVPPGFPPRQAELLERSLRLLMLTEVALEDDGAAATALQADQRRRVLLPLRTAARRGVAAATETWAAQRRAL